MNKRSEKPDSMRRWLTSAWIAAIALLAVFVIGGFYRITVISNEQAFVAKMDGTLANLRDALSMPLWTIDNPSVKRLGDAMLQGDLVVRVVVRDDDGKTVFTGKKDTSEETILRSIPVHHREAVVGELELGFSRESLRNEIKRELTLFAGWGGILLMFGFWIWRLRREMKLRKRMEKELFRSKEEAEAANAAKSVFLANMSHELRTPLSAILGFSEMLGHDPDASLAQKEKITIINRSGEHLLGMINDVLDLSKVEAGRVHLEPEVFDLPLMLEDLTHMFEVRAESAQLHFELDLDPALVRHIKADIGKLRQILINLIGNAVKFTSKGGVSLRARTLPIPDDPLMVTLQLEVQDNGPGIVPELLERIFEPFVQTGTAGTGPSGTGLGLAITKSFVKLLGGEIQVESKLDEGTLFHVELPVALAEAAEAGGIETARPAILGLEPGQPVWRILVVEDNPENRLLLNSLLLQAGFETREAENGEQAVALFEQWQPHFIWMDMRMPVMDGYQATAKIRELPGGDKVKIVAITASAFKEELKSTLATGCNDVLHKPFRAQEVFDAMARHLDVQYLYRETERESGRNQGLKLTPEMLDELPRELLQELRETSLALDREATLQAIERIEAQAPETAEGLRTLVQDFQMGRFGELLGKVKEEKME